MTEFKLSFNQEDDFETGAEMISSVALAAYGTLLWSEGVPEDAEIHRSVVIQIFLRVADFLSNDEVRHLIAVHELDAETVGHNMILSGNGHGAGFWDIGLPPTVGEALHKASVGIDIYADDYGVYYAD